MQAVASHVFATARAMRSFDEFYKAVHVTAVILAYGGALAWAWRRYES